MLVSNSLQVIMEAVKWLSSLTAVNPTKRLGLLTLKLFLNYRFLKHLVEAEVFRAAG